MSPVALSLFLLLFLPSAEPWAGKQPTCRANCLITADGLLFCASPASKISTTDVAIDCSASRLRNGLRLVIGNYENVKAIAPKGLAIFSRAFANQPLILRINLKITNLDPDSIFPVLPKLRSLALLEPPKQPCLFANVSAPLLERLEFECFGLDLWRPFELVLPSSKPQLSLKKCALALECRSCGPKTVAIATKGHHIRQSQRMPDHTCPSTSKTSCPVCARFTTTSAPPSTTPAPFTNTSSAPPRTTNTSDFANHSPTAVAVAVVKSAEERGRSNAVARQRALVVALERRLVRTQNLLIVILCLTLANSFVLIGLCGYFARRRRWSLCGQRKDIYAVAKTAAA